MFASGAGSPQFVNANTFTVASVIWSFLSAAVNFIITLYLCLVLRSEVKGFNLDTDDILRQ